MTIVPDAWLTATMGRPSFRRPCGKRGAGRRGAGARRAPAGGAGVLLRQGARPGARRRSRRSKAPALPWSKPRCCSSVRSPQARTAGAGRRDGLRVRAAVDERRARHCRTRFRYSRFHVDPQIGLDTANRVKREWIRELRRWPSRRCPAGRASRMVACSGFNAMLVSRAAGS